MMLFIPSIIVLQLHSFCTRSLVTNLLHKLPMSWIFIYFIVTLFLRLVFSTVLTWRRRINYQLLFLRSILPLWRYVPAFNISRFARLLRIRILDLSRLFIMNLRLFLVWEKYWIILLLTLTFACPLNALSELVLFLWQWIDAFSR